MQVSVASALQSGWSPASTPKSFNHFKALGSSIRESQREIAPLETTLSSELDLAVAASKVELEILGLDLPYQAY